MLNFSDSIRALQPQQMNTRYGGKKGFLLAFTYTPSLRMRRNSIGYQF